MNDVVSIITPMYNAEHYVAETMDSVLKQTYENWEMIIVDDCSTDQSPDIVKQYAKKDGRIRYYRNTQNLGVAKSRNAAIEFATGRYIAFLDSDDRWLPGKLEKQLTYMKEHQSVFCFSACAVIDAQGRDTGKRRKVPKKTDYKRLLKENVIPCLTVILDTQGVSQIRMPEVRHEDYALWLDILKSGISAEGIPEVLAQYREDESSLSGNKRKAAMWHWNILYHYEGLHFWKAVYYMIWYVYYSVSKRI